MNSADAISILKEYAGKINSELENYLDKKIGQAGTLSNFSKELAENIKEYNLRGGKRLRPVFLIFGYKCMNGKNEDEIVKASISLELMQGFLLVHDDIMDQDPIRRGRPSFHKIYEKIAEDKFPGFDSGRFGEAVGIAAGDILYSFTIDAIVKSDFPVGLKQKALKKVNEICYNTALGQVLDFRNGASSSINEEDIMKVLEYKTAKYTVEGPLHVGAILAGANENELKKLSDYALPLGIAFQIQDDILGTFGKEKETGKPSDSDLKEGKKTLLVLKAFENADENQKKKLELGLGNENLSEKEADELREIIKETGAYAYAKDKAEKLINEAKKAISNSNFSEEGKSFLIGIADYMLERDY